MSNQIPAEPQNTLAREMVCFIPRVMENMMSWGGGWGESYTAREISFSIQPVSPHFTKAESYVSSKEALK